MCDDEKASNAITTMPRAPGDGVLSALVQPAAKCAVVGGLFVTYSAMYAVAHNDVERDRLNPQRHDEIAETVGAHPTMLRLFGNAAQVTLVNTTAAASLASAYDAEQYIFVPDR